MSEELKTYVILFPWSDPEGQQNEAVVRAIISKFKDTGAEVIEQAIHPRQGFHAKLPKSAVDEIVEQFTADPDGRMQVMVYPLATPKPK